MPSDRVMVFIDGSNLELAINDSFNKRVSPEMLVNKLVEGRRLMRTHYYEAPLLEHINRHSFTAQQRYFERLRLNPFFDIRLGRRVKRTEHFTCPDCNKTFEKTTYRQKGVDALVAFDLVTLATRDAFDIAILVAGDQDFVCPVLEVRMMGKKVENAFTERAWALPLKDVVDRVILLNENYLEGCWQQ